MSDERNWEYGIGRRVATVLIAPAFVGVALLPFWLLVFLARGGAGELGIGTGLALLSVGLVAVLFSGLAIQLVRSAVIVCRWRIALSGAHLTLRVPKTWAGPHIHVPFLSLTLPIEDIHAVERRDEVVRTFGIPALTHVLSIATKPGDRIVLARRTDQEIGGPSIEEIGEAIAGSAKTRLIDRGTVEAPSFFASTFLGRQASWEGVGTPPALRPDEAANVRRKAALALQIALGLSAIAGLLRACSPQ